ncbi:MAG: hypothetical protein AAGP08_06975 [Pseudomonadota bacterium]
MVEKRPLDDLELDAMFAAARDEAPLPSADLVGRILADAEAVATPLTAAQPAAARPKPRGGFLAAIGGWPSFVGLATTALVGVAVGLATPETLDTWSGGYLSAALGYGVGDLMPSLGGLIEEG